MGKPTQLHLLGCLVCGSDIPSRRRGTCSPECKRAAKSIYDADRYTVMRQDKIASAQVWYERNRDRKRVYDAEYRERTRERRCRLKREYGRAHPVSPESNRKRSAARRARKAGGGSFVVLDRDMRRMLARYRNACAECEASFAPDRPLEWDHIVPVVRGGRHSIGNLQPLCRDCNRSKHVKFRIEWRYGVVVSVREVPQLPKAG